MSSMTHTSESPLRLGQLAPKGTQFCPFAAVAKWPYRFFQKPDSETISQAFFTNGKFKSRNWTLFYIHTHIQGSKPLVLIPASEVEDLFHEIKKKLHLLVYFPSPVREPGFLLRFDHDMPRPRFLGKLSQAETFETLEARIPKAGYKEDDEGEGVDNRSFAAFKRMMEDAVEATKNKSRSSKEKKKTNRILAKQGWVSQMKRVQCYLGVRPRQAPTIPVNPDIDPDVDFYHFEEAKRKYDIALCINLPNIDLSRRVPYSCDKDVVFVCVDVEAYEKANRPVTEIGISSLDTRDLRDLPPGDTGKLWMRQIRSRHFRITETAHLINKEFVAGCPDRFEFGVSEWVSSKDIPQTIASCFRPPFAAIGNMTTLDDSPDNNANTFLEKRNIVLVGHAVSTDIEYLRKVGYDVANLSSVLEAVDTANLYCAWQHEQQSTKLGSVLVSLGLTGWNLHNAGNDAAYTLQAMVGIAIESLATRKERHTSYQYEEAVLTDALELQARAQAKEIMEEWAAADVEGGDGGEPVRLQKHCYGWDTPDLQTQTDGKKAVVLEKENKIGKIAENSPTSQVVLTPSAKKRKQEEIKTDVKDDTALAVSDPNLARENWMHTRPTSVGGMNPYPPDVLARLALLEQNNKDFRGVPLP